jgi:hypothetical protein
MAQTPNADLFFALAPCGRGQLSEGRRVRGLSLVSFHSPGVLAFGVLAFGSLATLSHKGRG